VKGLCGNGVWLMMLLYDFGDGYYGLVVVVWCMILRERWHGGSYMGLRGVTQVVHDGLLGG